ncbi:unnamed protein product [Kluyveromyces dobzhanskii CBS 2104]|uniref:WGS project CCBQ000000000 data, contig 00099 n=1 Tax=Kluyveromyces dobzhanskii CBS 2104 TaxID=1427455 RepID=A0A0A8L478_9SACH|nr:unnamed protein product [Kluyveromyces dobzhanskii CBS 2104]
MLNCQGDTEEDLGFALKELKLAKKLKLNSNLTEVTKQTDTAHAVQTEYTTECTDYNSNSINEPNDAGREEDAKSIFERQDDGTRESERENEGCEHPKSVNDADNDNTSTAGSALSLEWQPITAIASFDIYDENGELVLKGLNKTESTLSLNEQNTPPTQKSTFGYTKIDGEEQAQRSYVTNKRTDFLFNHKKLAESSASLPLSQGKTSTALDSRVDSNDEEEEAMGSKSITTVEQLSITKDLLDDKEKFAYIASISVLVNEMCTALVSIALSSHNMTSKQKFAKRLQTLQKNMGHWKNLILNRLYAHLEIEAEEIKMLSRLSNDGIELSDLCKCLTVTQKIDNPLVNPEEIPELKIEKKDDKDLMNSKSLDIDVAWTIICDLFLLLVQDSHYDARSRSLLIKFADVLEIDSLEICQFERRVIDALELEQCTEDQVWDEKDHMDKRRKATKRKKICYIGLATLGGSLVLGLSGGLLAPVIGAGFAAGLSTIGVTGAAGFLTGIGGTTVVAVSSTAIGAKIGTTSMKRRMGSVRTFEFRPLHNNRRLNLILSVSGWMNGNEDDVRLPFSTVDPINGDLYSLYWEPDMLRSTGQTMSILASEIVTQTIQQILGATVLTALMAAIQLPNMLSKLGYLIDNPWNVSLDRAWAAGLVLADTLMAKNLGDRPITLVGFSLGSRVIYSCLVELAKHGAIGIVENVYLFGSPVVHKRDEMILARSVVSGRFLNGYSNRDWILGYLFRATGGGLSTVAGICPINSVPDIENVDCSDIVDGHMSYRKKMPKLLEFVGISVLSDEFVEIEDPTDPELVARQRKLVAELESAQEKLSGKSNDKTKKKHKWLSRSSWFKPQKVEWQEMYEQTLKDKTAGTEESPKTEENSSSQINETQLIEEISKLKEEVQKDIDHSSRDIVGK